MTWRALRQLLFAGLFASVLSWSPARAPGDDIEALYPQYQTHLKQRHFADAEVLARQMVAIADKSAQEKPALLAECLRYLGDVCSELHRHDEAESAFKRLAAIREEIFGPDYLLVAVPLNNLACLYQQLGRFDEAEPLFKRVLQMRETSLGADHTLVAHSLNNLGCLYDSLGRYPPLASLMSPG